MIASAWSHMVVALAGLWLVSAPAVFGYGDPAAQNHHIIGPLILAFSITAWWEITRGLRWLNVALGAWLMVAPFFLSYSGTALLQSVGVGVVAIGFSLIKGKTETRYGEGWRGLFRMD